MNETHQNKKHKKNIPATITHNHNKHATGLLPLERVSQDICNGDDLGDSLRLSEFLKDVEMVQDRFDGRVVETEIKLLANKMDW